MKNKFTLGVIAGMSTLTLAVPVLAQVSGAQMADEAVIETTSAPAGDRANGKNMRFERKAPDLTQAGVQTMIDHDTTLLANIDAAVRVQKSAIQARITALTAPSSITEHMPSQDASKAAHGACLSTVKPAGTATTKRRSPMHFGGPMMGGPKGGHGFMKDHRQGPGDLAEKLGMTADELKTELDAGKTIEDIASEKGITLPARPEKGMMKMGQPSAQ